MTKITIKHIHKVRKRLANGKEAEYHYLYRGGPRFWSSSDLVPLGGPAYFELYQEAISETKPSRHKFREIIQAYLNNPHFKKLKERSKKDIKTSIFHSNGIDARFGNAPQQAFNDHRIRKQAYAWRDEFAETSLRVADMRMAHLCSIVSWAQDRGYLVQHHLKNIKHLYNANRAEVFWTEEEISEFCSIAPEYVKRVLIVATETGLGPGDMHRLNRAHFVKSKSGLRIIMRRGKNNNPIDIPVTPKMQQILDETPDAQFQILVGARGEPLSNSDQFGQKVRIWKKKTSIERELHLYDARGTAATKLFAAGVSLRDLALFMGWTVETAAKMVKVYCSMHPVDNDDVLIKLENYKANDSTSTT